MIRKILVDCKQELYDKKKSFKIIDTAYRRGFISLAEKTALQICIEELEKSYKKTIKTQLFITISSMFLLAIVYTHIFIFM